MQTAAEILKRELVRRCESNPRYSLRAFARTLGVSPAILSLVINGRRPASRRILERMAACLNLRAIDREALVRSQIRGAAEPTVVDNIDIETVERVCHWISYAILSLTLTRDFKPDLKWIAKRLGVTVHETRLSVDALSAVGLLDMTVKPWRVKEGIRINNRISTAATRDFQRQLITRALEAMENLPMDERDLTSITFAMSHARILEAKEEIRKFRLRMAELFEEKGVSDDVYNLTVQLIPATRGIK